MTSSFEFIGLKTMGEVPMIGIVVSLFGAMSMGCSPERFPDTPLFSGIEEAEYDRGRVLIEQRVTRSYPVGSKEAGLAEYLKSQGLTVSRDDKSEAPGLPIYGKASFTKDRGGCDIVVGVDWRADESNIIRDVSVRYSDVGCM